MSRTFEMNRLICVSTTFATKEDGLKMAQRIIEEKLVACAQLQEHCLSLYRWKGQIMQKEEYVLLMKTAFDRYVSLEKYIKEHHPYDVPEIIATEIIDAEPSYAQWIEDEISG